MKRALQKCGRIEKASMGMKRNQKILGGGGGTGLGYIMLKASHRQESFLAAKAKGKMCTDESSCSGDLPEPQW